MSNTPPLLYLLFLVLSPMIHAQEIPIIPDNSFLNKIEWGFELGRTRSGMFNEVPPIFRKLSISDRRETLNDLSCKSLALGLLGRYQKREQRIVSFEVGVSYREKGSCRYINRQTKLRYLQLPLTMNFNFFPLRTWGLYFKMGVYNSFLLLTNNHISSDLGINRYDAGVLLGWGVRTFKIQNIQFELWIQRGIGLTNANSYFIRSLGGNQYEQQQRNASFEFGIIGRWLK